MSGRQQGALVAVSLLCACALAACSGDAPEPRAELPPPGAEIVLLTRNAPTTFYYDRHGNAVGPEVDMVRDFAAANGWQLRIDSFDHLDDLFAAVQACGPCIAGAGLTALPDRHSALLSTTPYQNVTEVLACRRGGVNPRRLEELPQARIVVTSGSSFEQRLQALESSLPGLRWQAVPRDVEQLLQDVWERRIDCTIADSNVAAINRRYHPELTVPLTFPGTWQFVWYLPPRQLALRDAANAWLQQYRASGGLARTLDRYYGKLERYDYVDTRRFLQRIDERLPRYRPLFEEAAAEHDLAWTRLAALSYQESHWNPRARSPTGVRGLMMLTLVTARELGVESRFDPQQSIDGAARYLARLRARLPAEVMEPDRSWMALAAYNVGYGHLQDAMELARELGRNPYAWNELKSVLPLLSQPEYYQRTRYGYARGHEPVRYVQRVRNYEDLLRRALDSVPTDFAANESGTGSDERERGAG